MNQSNHLVIRAAQFGGLAILLFGHTTGAIAREVDLKSSAVPHSNFASSDQVSGLIPISRLDADTIETWLLRDIRKSHFADFGIGGWFFWQAELVLERPHAKTELAQIVARKDLPPHLRVYAQEMLMKAGQPRNPSLVEDYCYTLKNSDQINLFHELWGLPGELQLLGEFGKTLISYRQAALPCLSRLLNDKNELRYGGSGELRALGRGYRIADLAAYFITQILDLPYNNDANPAVRYQQIQALRQRLGIPPDIAKEQFAPVNKEQFAPVRFSPNTAIDELVVQRSRSKPTMQYFKP